MPIPVIAGIPWLAGVIGGLFAAIFSYFAKFFTKRFAVAATLIALVTSATAGFITVITGLMATISVVAPDWLVTGAQLVVPSNATACASVVVTARLARWAYEWNVRIIQYKLF